MISVASPLPFKGYRFPRPVISFAVWVSLSTVIDVKGGKTEHGIRGFAKRSHHRNCSENKFSGESLGIDCQSGRFGAF